MILQIGDLFNFFVTKLVRSQSRPHENVSHCAEIDFSHVFDEIKSYGDSDHHFATYRDKTDN